MIVLSCNNLNKSFGIDSILEDVSFTVNEGDKIGIIGINGTGKTTLFKIISGAYGYDSGDIYTSKDCEIGYLEQNMNFHSENTVLDEVLEVFRDLIDMEAYLRNLELKIADESTKSNSTDLDKLMNEYSHKLELFADKNGYGYKSEARGVLKGLGFSDEDLDKPIGILSGGEKTRILLGKLLLKKPTLLMLDEPTNHLDSEAIEWLELFLKQYKGTVMLISHDRYFLDQVVTRTFEIHNKKLKTYNGNYSKFLELSKIEKELELKKYEDQQKDLKKQEESIERLKAYGREKHLKRARSKEKALDKIEVLDKPESYRKKARIEFNPSIVSGNDVLQVRDVSMGYENRILFKDLNLDMTFEELYSKISISNISDTRILRITVTDEDPKRAADIANRLAEYGITSIEEIESKSPYMVERAVVKTNKINMSSSKVITIGAALGFVASIFGLFAMYILDDKVRTAEEIERILDVPVLVGINESKILMKTDNYWTKKRRKK